MVKNNKKMIKMPKIVLKKIVKMVKHGQTRSNMVKNDQT